MEHPEGPKKKKRVLWVLIGVLAVLALLAAVYAYLAFMPTGYGSMQEGVGAANKRIDDKLAPQVKVTAPAGISTQPPVTYAISKDGKREIRQRMDFFDEFRSLDSYNAFWSAVMMVERRQIGSWDPTKPCLYIPSYPYQDSCNVIMVHQHIPMATRPRTGRPVWADLETSHTNVLLTRFEARFFLNTGTTGTTARQDRVFLQYLDRLEGFLLRDEWDIPASKMSLRRDEGGLVFDRLALLAIARASLKGDQARAMNLLDRYLEALRVLHLRHEDGDMALRLDGATHVFFGVAELPDFPAEGWQRARRILDSMRLSEAEMDGLRRVRCAWYHDRLVEDASKIEPVGNTWHFIFDGKLEKRVNETLMPIARRKAEQIALSVYKRDRNALIEAWEEWARIHQMMNSRDSFSPYQNGFLSMLENVNQVDILNGQIDRAVLWLEAARTRHDRTAQAPLTVLGAQQMEAVTIPRFGCIQISGRRLDDPGQVARLKPLLDAVNRFRTQTRPRIFPTTQEEIESVLKAAGPGDWSEFVKWHEPVPVLVVWNTRTVMRGNAWMAVSRNDRNKLHELIDVIELHAIAVNPPVIGEEMRRILRDER